MRLLLTIILALTLIGCTQRVEVVDPAGKPVEGANVAAVTASMNGAPATTDAMGQAPVAMSIGFQTTQWISVSKAGYESQQVPVPDKWPLKIVLQPSPPQ